MPQWLEYIIFFIILLAFLAMVVFWIWGTIHPASFNKIADGNKKGRKSLTRKGAFFGFGFLAIVLFILSGITANWAGNPDFNLSGFTKERAVTDDGAYEINGSTYNKDAKLTIDGKAVKIDDSGKFRYTQSLKEGDNQVKLVILNTKGRKTEETITIHRTTTSELAARNKPHSAVLGDKTTASPTPTPTPKPTPTPTPAPPTSTPKPIVTPRPATPKPAPPATSSCDSNYSGCVPIASDVDCAGGSGNGPAYVQGPVKILGVDIYKLDADHDGWGCN
jgi:Glucodextranase, domain B